MQAVISQEALVVEAARAAQVAGLAVAEVLDAGAKLAPGLVLLQNVPGGPSSVGGSSGNVPSQPCDQLQARYTVHIEGIEGIASEIASLSKNNQDHIMADHHLWARLVKDPKDWDAIARIMTKVLKEGQEGLYIKNVYKKVQNDNMKMRFLNIGDEIVQVNFIIEDGVKMIGNGWVRP